MNQPKIKKKTFKPSSLVLSLRNEARFVYKKESYTQTDKVEYKYSLLKETATTREQQERLVTSVNARSLLDTDNMLCYPRSSSPLSNGSFYLSNSPPKDALHPQPVKSVPSCASSEDGTTSTSSASSYSTLLSDKVVDFSAGYVPFSLLFNLLPIILLKYTNLSHPSAFSHSKLNYVRGSHFPLSSEIDVSASRIWPRP